MCRVVPDFGLMTRVKLVSVNFQGNVILTREFFTLYELCKLQFSQHTHYDCGLFSSLNRCPKLNYNPGTCPTIK